MKKTLSILSTLVLTSSIVTVNKNSKQFREADEATSENFDETNEAPVWFKMLYFKWNSWYYSIWFLS